MNSISIADLITIVIKKLKKIIALCLACGLITYLFVSYTQTYTCTLKFEYTYPGATEGLAPDGAEGSKLDPYEIMSPVVIKNALDILGVKDNEITVENIRSSMDVNQVITSHESEVKESAAALGEDFQVIPTEYTLTYKYKAKFGGEFGYKLLSSVISSYDKWLEYKYHHKKNISKVVKNEDISNLDYIDTANIIQTNIQNNIQILTDLSEKAPEFRSKRTGYNFSELINLYTNLEHVQYSKYYANVRQGKLSKDTEMLIKRYNSKIDELTKLMDVDYAVSENYKAEIVNFYEPYKKSGLYSQALRTQTALNASNNKENSILEDYNLKDVINTYDDIITKYTAKGTSATDKKRQIDYYKVIIDDFSNDSVASSAKNRLIEKNKAYLSDIIDKSDSYMKIANDTIDEYYEIMVIGDLNYLLTTDIKATKPIKIITVFVMMLVGGLLAMGYVFYEILFASRKKEQEDSEQDKDSYVVKTFKYDNLDQAHKLAIEQAGNCFNEFRLIYQPVYSVAEGIVTHSDAMVRWESPVLGVVPNKELQTYIFEAGLSVKFIKWIIISLCNDLKRFADAGLKDHVIHLNLTAELLNDDQFINILVNEIIKSKVDPAQICIQVSAEMARDYIEQIVSLNDINIPICFDGFSKLNQIKPIIEAISPRYINLSADLFAPADAEAGDDSIYALDVFSSVKDAIDLCTKDGVKCCISNIESEKFAHVVEKARVDFVQGSYYGEYCPIDDHFTQINIQGD